MRLPLVSEFMTEHFFPVAAPSSPSGKSKRHHHVPRMLQKRFTAGADLLYFFNKRFPERGVQRTTSGNLFVVTKYHTFVAGDGTEHTHLEEMYSRLESRAEPVIEKLISCAREGVLPRLTPMEKATWSLFLFHQWKRSPDVQQRYFADFDQHLPSFVERFEREHRPLTDDERATLENSEAMRRIQSNVRINAMADRGEQVERVLTLRGIAIAVLRRPNRSFVIGSNPVVRLPPGGTPLTDPKVELWLPVASDVAVCSYGEPGTERIINALDASRIRTLNRMIFKQSTVIAACSRELVASIGGCG